jgi:hypothetical protein
MTTIDDLRVPADQALPDGQPLMRVLDRTGDTRLSWNPDDPGEVAAAKAHFDALRGKGYLATKRGAGGRETVHSFDPAAREITMQPQTVGG